MTKPTFLVAGLAFGLAALFHFASCAAEPPPGEYRPRVAAASGEGLAALKRFRLPPGVRGDLFAAEPLLANPVAFCLDERGRCYLAETFRLHAGVSDNRAHMDWLDDDLACRTVGDRITMYRRHLRDKFATFETEHDRVRLVWDTDGDGVADRATVFADGFHAAEEGLGSGLLAHRGNVYYTCIPHLWRLRDASGGGKADVRESLSTGYGVHQSFIGHDSHGLVLGPDGRLYFSIGDRGFNVATREGKHLFYPHTGAVLRCELDGSRLDVVHIGLRNPQELAFDHHGNLFTGDNNSDGGDAARWVQVVDGGDSGWRIGYQYGSALSPRGPWHAEKVWHLPHAEQPAHVVPPLAHLASGPSGLCFDPGVTALPERYADRFFLCDFRGTSGGSTLWAFRVRPKGATFEVVDKEEFIQGVLATDADFGPDGDFYVSDWVEGWGLTGKGRIYRFGDPERRRSAAVAEVKRLLAEGFDRRPLAELERLLDHADRRVRQGAQFALADRGSEALPVLRRAVQPGPVRLARLHALWGLGQLGRRGTVVRGTVAPLCRDVDAEVRVTAARVLADFPDMDALRPLLADPEPRVRAAAAVSLGRWLVAHPDAGADAVVRALADLLRDNADRDPYLRHAGAVALGSASTDRLRPLLDDESTAVRLGALLALRRRESAEVARFLEDRDPRLVLEAARAIHDVPIPAALPRLAALAARPGTAELVLFRALNAHFRLGGSENARAIAALAARTDVPEKVRVEAVKALGDWEKPPRRDRVTGLTQALPGRPADVAPAALRSVLGGVFAGPVALRSEAARVSVRLGIREVGPALRALLADRAAGPEARAEALRGLAAVGDPGLGAVVDAALADGEPRVRVAALRVLAESRPDDVWRPLEKALASGSVLEQQAVLALLGDSRSDKADTLLIAQLAEFAEGRLTPAIHLDLLEAAHRRRSPSVVAALRRARGDQESVRNRACLHGGDAEAGRSIFLHKAAVSCLRCHKVRGEGGDVGPDLTGVGTRQTREYLLEALLEPNKQIAKGYETVVLTTTRGLTVAGVLKSEDEREVRLMTADGKLVTVPKREIDERATGKSAMPDDVAKQLTKAELRDLVEFLAALK